MWDNIVTPTGSKNLFPWWRHAFVGIIFITIYINWGCVIVLRAIFDAPRMHAAGLKTNSHSRHAKLNHPSPKPDDMLKHRKKFRQSNLVLPNSKKEVFLMVFLFLRYFCVSSNNLSTRFCDVHEAMQITFNWFNQVLFMHYHDHNLNYVAWNQKYVLYMSLSDTLGNTNLKWLKHFNLRIIFNG